MRVSTVLALAAVAGVGAAGGALWAAPRAAAWAATLTAPETKAFWYASRSTGWVSYGLLWTATCLGLSLSGRVTRGSTAALLAQLHRLSAGLALVFVAVHALSLLGDRYVRADLAGVLIPFRFPERSAWVGLGQLGAYAASAVYGSIWLRRHTGYRFWRALHYAAFGAYGLATLHLLGAGTDVGPGAGTLVVTSAAVVAVLLGLRTWDGSARQASQGEVTGR
ncbi:MAG: ferric reductase [bacterium]